MDQNKTKTRKKPCFDLEVPQNTTYLQTYNCERQNGPKKKTVPAEKQVRRFRLLVSEHIKGIPLFTQKDVFSF